METKTEWDANNPPVIKSSIGWELGSMGWLNTHMGFIKHIGEWLEDHPTDTTHLEAWGKQIQEKCSEILSYYHHKEKQAVFNVGDKVKYYVPLMFEGKQDGQLEGEDKITRIHMLTTGVLMYCLESRGIRCFANELQHA